MDGHYTPLVCEEQGFHCQEKTVAFTSKDWGEINICPYFFEVEDYTAAITIIHELSHFRTSKFTLRILQNAELNKFTKLNYHSWGNP